MKKLVSALVLAALVLSACSPASPTAATVDGATITVNDVEALLSDTGAVDKETFARFLGAAIQLQIFFKAATEQYGFDPSDEEVTAEADSIFEANAAGQTRKEFLDQAGISEALFLDIARQQLIEAEIRAQLEGEVAPTEEDLQAAREQAALNAAEVCGSHILVATEDEALDVLARLEDGEEFADLAIELSTDTLSGAEGGDLGCASPARYVEPFRVAAMEAELNVPTDPVESEFGFHVLLITDRTEADPANLPSDEVLTEQLKPGLVGEAMNDWFATVLAAADVTVVEEYGTWSVGPPPGVTPPVA